VDVTRYRLYGDDPSPRLGFFRGVFLANHLASNDNLARTTKRQNTQQRKLTIHKIIPNTQQLNETILRQWQTEPGLVAFYHIRSGNGAGLSYNSGAVTYRYSEQTAVSEDKERHSTLEADVLSYVKRQRPQTTVFCHTNQFIAADDTFRLWCVDIGVTEVKNNKLSWCWQTRATL